MKKHTQKKMEGNMEGKNTKNSTTELEVIEISFITTEIIKLIFILLLEGIYITLFYNYLLLFNNKKEINFFLNHINYHRTIYIAIMTGGARIRLLEYLYDIYLKDLLSQPFCGVVKLYGMGAIITNNSIIRDIYLDTQIIPNDISRNHLCGKLYLAINDFLNNSKCDWFLRLCDDTFINLKAFSLFFNELNQGTNPLKDKLVQGNCIHKLRRANSYPQGGSGMIFSRFSVIELLSNFEHFKEICYYIKNDDTSIGIWLYDRNYTFRSMANRYFVGHRFVGFDKIIDIISKNSTIKPCPLKYQYNPNICRSFMTNLKNVVFWHDKARFMYFLPFAKKFIEELPEDLYFYQPDVRPRVCRSSLRIDGYLD